VPANARDCVRTVLDLLDGSVAVDSIRVEDCSSLHVL
jgi:hypothetical protein